MNTNHQLWERLLEVKRKKGRKYKITVRQMALLAPNPLKKVFNIITYDFHHFSQSYYSGPPVPPQSYIHFKYEAPSPLHSGSRSYNMISTHPFQRKKGKANISQATDNQLTKFTTGQSPQSVYLSLSNTYSCPHTSATFSVSSINVVQALKSKELALTILHKRSSSPDIGGAISQI